MGDSLSLRIIEIIRATQPAVLPASVVLDAAEQKVTLYPSRVPSPATMALIGNIVPGFAVAIATDPLLVPADPPLPF
jgi:hypothetical protein